jgi:RNA polymerase-binding protein DksA
MTKAKTSKTADAKDAKKDTKVVKAEKKAAPAKAEKKPAEKKPVAEKKVPPEKPAAKKPAKATKETDIVPAPAAKPANSFTNSGLGIKTAGKKPALSVAPGIMTLGRPAQPKQDQTPRPSERKLAKKELADIKSFLLEKRERLLAGMRRELAMQKERAASKAADEVDKATDAYDEDLSFEIATANDQELGDIQIALEKIDKGTYGECEVCGCGISPSRLKILPSATTCVACRGQEELTRRRDDGQSLFNIMEDGEGEAEPM